VNKIPPSPHASGAPLSRHRPHSATFKYPSQDVVDRYYTIGRVLVYTDLALARSVLLDIGLYIAECLRAVDPEMSWQRTKGDKRDMEYNYPVMVGRTMSCNPFWVPRNILGRVCDGKDPAQLVQAYRSYLNDVKQRLARRG